MCAICGIKAQNVSENLYKMLEELKHRGPDGSGVYINGKVAYGSWKDINFPKGVFGLGHNLLSIVGSEVMQPLVNDRFVLVCNGEIYNHHQLEREFELKLKTDSDCEIITALIKKFHRESLYQAVSETVQHLDGDYAFAVSDGRDLAVLRDPVGVKPVYYGMNQDISAFASERKALWKIGIGDVKTLPPGHILYNWKLKNMDFNLETIIKSYQKNFTKYTDYNHLKTELKQRIVTSVKKRVKGLSEIGIMFSGGVDSALLAHITQELGIETTLYCVGHKDSADFKFAQISAEDMALPLRLQQVEGEDVRRYLPPVLNAIEECNLMKLGVAMPAYIAAEMAREDGLKVMFSGQGADELFAGYHRYLDQYQKKGEEATKNLKEDILNLYHVNLERDDSVTMAHNVELRVPYLDVDVINMAMHIPMKYKIRSSSDRLRKCILREVAGELGVPPINVKRPKKAAQYGSGIDKMIRNIFKAEKIDYRAF